MEESGLAPANGANDALTSGAVDAALCPELLEHAPSSRPMVTMSVEPDRGMDRLCHIGGDLIRVYWETTGYHTNLCS